MNDISDNSQWPIQPTFLSLVKGANEGLKNTNINRQGMFYPDFLQGFLGPLATYDEIVNPFSLFQFVPEVSEFATHETDIEFLEDKHIDDFLKKNIEGKKIIRIDSGRQFPIKKCCEIYRKKCGKDFCWKQDSRVAIFANAKLKFNTDFEKKLTEIIGEYNTHYNLSDEYKIKIKTMNCDGKKIIYFYYLCPESQFYEYVFPITYSGKLIACLIQGQTISEKYGNYEKNKGDFFKSITKRKMLDKFLKKLKPESSIRIDNRIRTITERVHILEKRIQEKVEWHQQNYINKSFTEINNNFHDRIRVIKEFNTKDNSQVLTQLKKNVDKALLQIYEKFSQKNGFIRLFAVDIDSTSQNRFSLFAKSDPMLSENYTFNINYNEFWDKFKTDVNDDICIELTGDARQTIINSFTKKEEIKSKDILSLLPTLSPKIVFIIWNKYNKNEHIETFNKKLIDFYIFIAQYYTTIVSMRNEEMLETSIRVAGHEVENILPSAMNFLNKIKKMSTMDLLEYIPSGKYDNKMEDLEDQLELIKNIYDRPRLIFKEFKLKKTFTSLSFLLTRMAILFRNHADLRKMSIPAPDAFFNIIDINADKDLISHVFYNLLDNAVKYGYKGTNIHIKGEEKNGKLIIRIISYGSKIEDDSLIYALYYRGNNQKNRAEGLGIGMFVSKRIVDGHRFSIKHSSEKVNDENLPVKLSQIFRDTKTDWREYEGYKEMMATNENNELKYQPGTIETETTLSFSTHKNTFWIEIPDYGYKLKNN